MAIKHDVVPLDGADVFQQGEIDSIGDRGALSQDPGDFARLPVFTKVMFLRDKDWLGVVKTIHFPPSLFLLWGTSEREV